MAIYFLRHGESEANVKAVFDGQGLDAKLTSLGEKQASEAAKELLSLDIKKVYSSPLKRARKTAEIVSDIIGYPVNKIEFDKRLMEHDWGSLSGHSWDINEDIKTKLTADAETNKKFQERILSFFNDHKNENHNILIVCHGGVGSMLEASRRGIDVSERYEVISYPNAHVIKLNLDWLN
jgi:broad specificity phosphatase PhoE